MRYMQANVPYERGPIHPINWDTLGIIPELRVVFLVGTLMRAIISRLISNGRQHLGDVDVDQLAEGS